MNWTLGHFFTNVYANLSMIWSRRKPHISISTHFELLPDISISIHFELLPEIFVLASPIASFSSLATINQELMLRFLFQMLVACMSLSAKCANISSQESNLCFFVLVWPKMKMLIFQSSLLVNIFWPLKLPFIYLVKLRLSKTIQRGKVSHQKMLLCVTIIVKS